MHTYLTVKFPLTTWKDGVKTAVAGISTDISERKRAEEELQKKSAEIEQFIYTVSHDLRSPLVTIKTFMGFLEKDIAGNDQEQLAQDIQFIHSAADKMKMLLDELLEMSASAGSKRHRSRCRSERFWTRSWETPGRRHQRAHG